ncbi:MAG: hypothetical protein JSS32_04320 [Verrucomicrobia bacterium]|nr:hypothetical protein [Verrucomicrobiota bacterium]
MASSASGASQGAPIHFTWPGGWTLKQSQDDYASKMAPFVSHSTRTVNGSKLARCVIPFPKAVDFKVKEVANSLMSMILGYSTTISITFRNETEKRVFCWHYERNQPFVKENTELRPFPVGTQVDLLFPKGNRAPNQEALSQLLEQIKTELNKWDLNTRYTPELPNDSDDFLAPFRVVDGSIDWDRLRKSIVDFPKIKGVTLFGTTLTFECCSEQDALDLYELDLIKPLFPGSAVPKGRPFDQYIGFEVGNKGQVMAALADLVNMGLVPNRICKYKTEQKSQMSE